MALPLNSIYIEPLISKLALTSSSSLRTFILNLAVEETERLRSTKLEGISVLDFDLLCSTIVLQTQGKWRKFESSERDDDEYGGGVLRLWDHDVMDCLEDRHLCAKSICCPCYIFGKNMTRAGFGSCFLQVLYGSYFLQGVVYMILIVNILFKAPIFVVSKRHCFLCLAIVFVLLIGSYLGFSRMQIRRKFKIRGKDDELTTKIHNESAALEAR